MLARRGRVIRGVLEEAAAVVAAGGRGDDGVAETTAVGESEVHEWRKRERVAAAHYIHMESEWPLRKESKFSGRLEALVNFLQKTEISPFLPYD